MASCRGFAALPLMAVAIASLILFQQRWHLKKVFFGEDDDPFQGEASPVPPPYPDVSRFDVRGSAVQATMTAIDTALRSRGGVYATYSCQTVSWDDVSRGTIGGALSVWGANIADTRLWAKNGARLYTVRSENWNEKLGRVSADEVALVASRQGGPLHPVTLQDFLLEIGQYGGYAGLPVGLNLSSPKMDAQVSIRFQTTFLPVADTALGALQFAPEMYSYQTRDDSDPRNLLLLATTQGVAVQQDGLGATRLYSHAVGSDGKVRRHWFEAERSNHTVGGPQHESKAEKVAAASRGKATASVIGTRAMGTRFNVLATVQLPLKQKKIPRFYNSEVAEMAGPMPMTAMVAEMDEGAGPPDEESADVAVPLVKSSASVMSLRSSPLDMRARSATGQASAARVSQGSLVDTWHGVTVSEPERDDTQHVTVTIVLYNTVAGGIPSEKDVVAAVDDMEQLYRACGWNGKREEAAAAFSTAELTVKDVIDISTKIAKDPYKSMVENSDAFPTSRKTEG